MLYIYTVDDPKDCKSFFAIVTLSEVPTCSSTSLRSAQSDGRDEVEGAYLEKHEVYPQQILRLG
jgi:hypothetical protein